MIERLPTWALVALEWVTRPRTIRIVAHVLAVACLVALGVLYGVGAFALALGLTFFAAMMIAARFAEREEEGDDDGA